MRTATKSLLVEKYFHLSNRDLAKLIYGEVNERTLSRIRVLKSKLRKRNESNTKAYISIDLSNSSRFRISFNDLKHYELSTPFYHDSFNNLNLRYLADIARYVNSRTLRDARFEAILFQYLQYYLQYFEKNEKGNIKLYIDTNKQIIRGHHRNKALLYYILIIIYCRFYRCPNEDNKKLLKEIIFTEHEDAEHILNFYRNPILDILSKEIFS